ncbi:Hexose carrier protein HEX6 [Acorus gramineus]|uniref:Hexose carrier protein HEX6 n=1 Tax=Acorus gramineus TaxID=55184 RepID=A0AAV9BBG0_ACOGR|nr:Hexose carrier protein HEX6 [Acorus gramineus]
MASALYNGRMTPFVVLSCMTSTMGGVIFGYDIGISGGVTSMTPFLEKFFPDVYARMTSAARSDDTSNYCKFDSQLLTAFTSSLFFAGLIASLFASSVTSAFGRRPSILLGGAAFLVGAVLGGVAVNVYMLIIGRVLLGIVVGFASQSVPLYLSEMAPPKYRGAFNNGFHLSIGVGYISATLINYFVDKLHRSWGWRVSLALAAVPASALALGALFLPETPNSLIHRASDNDDLRRAEALLRRIRGAPDVRAEFNDMVRARAASESVRLPLRELMTARKHRPQLVVAFAIPFFQQVTGINVVAFYSPLLFRTIGLGESASLLSAVLTGLVGSGATFLSMLVVDRLGRRTLFFAGGAQMLVSLAVVGGVLAARLHDQGELLGKGWAWVVLIAVWAYVAGYGWSWGPLGWLVPSEVFPLEVRSAGQGVAVAVNFTFTFAVAQSFLPMLCHLKAGLFFFFGGWVVLMTGFVWALLPETRGVPIEKMEEVWRKHWFWKRVVGGEGKMDVEVHGIN